MEITERDRHTTGNFSFQRHKGVNQFDFENQRKRARTVQWSSTKFRFSAEAAWEKFGEFFPKVIATPECPLWPWCKNVTFPLTSTRSRPPAITWKKSFMAAIWYSVQFTKMKRCFSFIWTVERCKKGTKELQSILVLVSRRKRVIEKEGEREKERQKQFESYQMRALDET